MEKQKIDPDVFETAYAEFWESEECTQLNNVIYRLMKAAFIAGVQAAGKEPPCNIYPGPVTK